MQCKEKDVYNFFLAVLTSQWRHKMGYRRFSCIMFVALKWLKTSIDALNDNLIQYGLQFLREIDVDLTSMCWKKHIVYQKIILEIRVCLATKIRS